MKTLFFVFFYAFLCISCDGLLERETPKNNREQDISKTIPIFNKNPDHNFQLNYPGVPTHEYSSDYHQKDSANLPKRHLLVWLENPHSEAYVNWGIDGYSKGMKHTVFVSKSPHFGENLEENYEIQIPAFESGLTLNCTNKDANIHAKLENLEPNTTYYYVVKSEDQRSKEMHFITSPRDENVSFKLLSGGDSRTDHSKRREMNREIKKLVSMESEYLALIHGGDFISKGKKCKQWYHWREDHQETILENGRILPLIPTFGNHEVGGEKNYRSLFNPQDLANNFYFHTILGSLNLIILNSEKSVEGDQKDWLQAKLEEISNKTGQFIVVSYHRAAWPAVKNPAATKVWVPLLEKYQVDLVLESDGHTMKQTCPIFAGACNKHKGIIYVGEGGLGVKQRLPTRKFSWYFQGGYALRRHHVQSLYINSYGGATNRHISYQVFYDDSYHYGILLPEKLTPGS